MKRWQYWTLEFVISLPVFFAVSKLAGFQWFVAVICAIVYPIIEYFEGRKFAPPKRVINIYIDNNEKAYEAVKRVLAAGERINR